MDRIKSKQVEGAMDLASNQEVMGSKEFSAPQHFPGEGLCMSLHAGFLYWCQNQGTLEESGNSRLKVEEGQLIIELFDGEQWRSP